MGFKDAIKEFGERGVSIPIREEMLQAVMGKATAEQEGVQNLSIQLIDNEICLSGSVKKLLLTIPFKVYLVPVEVQGRLLQFRIQKIEPLNQDWINSKIFNRAPLVYEKGEIFLDLNSFEPVRKVRFGNFKHFRIEGKTLWVGVGI